MSGGVKAGLIFGAVAIPLTIASSFVPFAGVICCGPLLALALGAVAGYLGVRWSGPEARIGQGVLAGGISGAGALIGSVLFFTIAVLILMNSSDFEQMIRQSIEQSGGSGSQMRAEDVRLMAQLAGPIGGFCFGAFGLAFAVAGGALGGWLMVRQRRQEAAPPAEPPAAPSF